MKKLMCAALVTALFPAIAEAAPVYLNCVLDGPGQSGYNLTLDEAAGQVTYEVTANGNTFKVPGIFTSDKVSFGSSGTVPIQWTVNRVDPTFSRSITIATTDTVFGRCTIAAARKRAF